MTNISPIIFGMSGTTLTDQERDFFKQTKPHGFILFARNIESAPQIKSLTDSLRELSGNENLPILIDQEGGRVARIVPPIMQGYPAAQTFGEQALINLTQAKQDVYDNYFRLGSELKDLGINFNCAPVADLYFDYAHKIIGTRSFGSDPEIVSALCIETMRGLKDAGVTPIFKHAPGHGRALCDSHEDLPTVTTSMEELCTTDFKAFQNLRDHDGWVMTAHIKFTCIDPDQCITLSSKGISFLRNELGLKKQVIISDDLSMKALKGDLSDLAQRALHAGCDLILHCNGKMDEMLQVHQGYTSHLKS